MKDQAKLEREALRMAVADARSKAEAAAAGAGRRSIGSCVSMSRGVALPVPALPDARGRPERRRRRRAPDCGRADGDSGARRR